MKRIIAGKMVVFTDCKHLDTFHQDMSGRPWCVKKNRYVRGVVTKSRPNGCKCQDYVFDGEEGGAK